VLRKIYGPKWEEAEGEWRRLHCEKLHNFCASPIVIRVLDRGKKFTNGILVEDVLENGIFGD